jgi:bifunctional non-homologous end joining protein LigD
VVVPAADGTTDFSVLQNELRGKSKARHDRFRSALSQRPGFAEAATLRTQNAPEKVDREDRHPVQRKFGGRGQRDVRARLKVGLEGVVSKVRDSRYLSGRGRDWVKKTCAQREKLTIAGLRSTVTIRTASMSAAARAMT